MKFSDYSTEIAARLLVRRVFVYAFFASLLTNVVLAAGLAGIEDKERIVVLPAEPTKSFWMDNRQVSKDYLEQMAVYVLQLVLNNSPETVSSNTKKLLSYVVPDERGQTELMLTKQARRLKSSNASSSFIAESVFADEGNMTVAIAGRNRRFIGSQQTANVKSCWKVAFDYKGSRLWVKTLVETDCADPFEEETEDKENA